MENKVKLSTSARAVQEHWRKTQEFKGEGYESYEDKLHAKRVLVRRKYLAKLITDKKPKKVLEIGCFGGYNLRLIHEIDKKIELFGFDINKNALKYAKEKLPAINTVNGSIYELEKYFKENTFDLVFTAGVLIHIPCEDIEQALAAIMSISKQHVIHAEHHGESSRIVDKRMRWIHDFNKLYGGHEVSIETAPNPSNGFQEIIQVKLNKEI